MRNLLALMILMFMVVGFGCAGDEKPASPLETFKTYTKAIKKKDYTTMKQLLSADTLKMHADEAKSQGVTVDDILKRETLFNENQTSVEFRNEKIEGDKATLEVKDPMGYWQTLYFVLENGEWKINKKASADQLMQEIEEENRKADEQFNSNQPFPETSLTPTPLPSVEPSFTPSPTPPLDAGNANKAAL